MQRALGLFDDIPRMISGSLAATATAPEPASEAMPKVAPGSRLLRSRAQAGKFISPNGVTSTSAAMARCRVVGGAARLARSVGWPNEPSAGSQR
jgi:hypothetical protein